MKKLLATVCAVTMAMGGVMSGVAPVVAAPMVPQPTIERTSDVQNVQERRYREGRRGYYRQGDRHYYNGYRGYRHHRPGYRRHGDFWFPAGAFIAGAIISGAMNDGPRRAPRATSRHVSWCYDRYRSYRSYDNTYQPNNGPRRQCVSPYR